MGTGRTDEFRKDTVRIALTSGLTRGQQRGVFPIDRLYQVMNVSPRGLRAFQRRPASRRQRTDMVVLAHIKEQFRLSLGRWPPKAKARRRR